MRTAFGDPEFDYIKFRGTAARVVTDPVSGRGQVLRVGFPKGNGFPGHAAEIVLPDSAVATVQYRMLFDASFRSTMYGGATVGGKLPGLGAVGGTSAYDTGSVGRTVSGLKPPMHCVGPVRPSDGWSARHMWSAGGGLHQYLYHSGRRNNCGDANHLSTADQLSRYAGPGVDL